MHRTNKYSSQQDLHAINLASMRILCSTFCILTKDGIKWLKNSTRQYFPSFEAKVKVYGVFSCLQIKQTNKQKKKITHRRTFIKMTLASERILCGALCILAKDGIKWLENEE